MDKHVTAHRVPICMFNTISICIHLLVNRGWGWSTTFIGTKNRWFTATTLREMRLIKIVTFHSKPLRSLHERKILEWEVNQYTNKPIIGSNFRNLGSIKDIESRAESEFYVLYILSNKFENKCINYQFKNKTFGK